MELKIKVDKRNFVEYYLTIFSGGLKLTNKELDLLKEIVFKYTVLIEDGVTEPYIGQLVFSPATTAELLAKFKWKPQNLSNHKAQLIKKGVLREGVTGTHLNPKMIPQKTLTFNFEVYE